MNHPKLTMKEEIERMSQSLIPRERKPLPIPLVEQLAPLFQQFRQIMNQQNALLEEINSKEIPEPKVTVKPAVVNVPPQKSAKEWLFTVNRDNRGLIDTITAKKTEED